MSDKQAYEKKLEAKLHEWQADIDKLKAQAESANADAQAQYEDELHDLRNKRDEVHKRLQEVQTANLAAWKDVKQGADEAWGQMSDAMKKAWNRYS